MRIPAKDSAWTQMLLPQRNTAVQTGLQALSARAGQDRLTLSPVASALAGKIHFREEISLHSSASAASSEMSAMNQSMTEVETLLNGMLELSKQADDESLSDAERIDLQIQMTRLQAQLYKKTYGMSLGLAGRSAGSNGNFGMARLDVIHFDEEMTLELLERERARLATGEESGTVKGDLLSMRLQLRVEKHPATAGFTEFKLDEDTGKFVHAENPDVTFADFVAEKNGRAPASSPSLPAAINKNSGPTDEERLSMNRLQLLDAESAQRSTKKIEKSIEELAGMQEAFADLQERLRAEAYSPGDFSQSLEDSANASQFKVSTALGVMELAHGERDERSLLVDPESNDVRLSDSKGGAGRLYQQLDSLFKDKIYKTLGFGDMWKTQAA